MRTLTTAMMIGTGFALFLGGCKDQPKPSPAKEVTQQAAKPASAKKDTAMAKPAKPGKIVKADTFTYANYDEVQMTHLSLDLDVNFDKKTLDGTAVIDFKPVKPGAHILKLDTADLDISSVQGYTRDGEWVAMDYALRDKDPVMGTMLSIPFSKGTSKVKITYKTNPKAGGLQWLSPEQTKDGKFPYLFSQNETIFARSMAPLQDTPAVRITYDATLRVPKGMRALMSAEQLGQDKDGAWHFKMPQAIPSYLIAIAVGEIDYRPIDAHTGVYAEPYILEKAAHEFEDTPKTEKAMSSLYGPYRWGQYDMLILPPSFPFGGMENPRLTFLTPTLVVGDKSLVDVVTHELAHSWSGNLVTNASWRDAWLNEGFTTYVENRVTEKTEGKRRADMEQVLALDGLKRDLAGASRPEMTWLKLPADMHHPDDAFSLVAYNKGMFFLMFLEDRFGRDNFDSFLKNYFNHFAVQSITTEDFLAYFKENLMAKYPGKVTMDEVNAWIYGPGLPDTVRKVHSDAFEAVQKTLDQWTSGQISVAQIDASKWTTQEWLYFLNRLPKLDKTKLRALDKAFHLTGTPNAEIAFAWYMQGIKADYAPMKPALEKFLLSVGRGKFIYRLYGALANQSSEDRKWANTVYKKARSGYHPIAQGRIEAIFTKADKKK